jgi:glycosidase
MLEYPNFNIVGEEWTTNPVITAYWQKDTMRHDDYHSELPSVMDFPFQNALIDAIKKPETWSTGLRQLYEVFAMDFLYGDAYNLVTFGDNHDMSRLMTQFNNNVAEFNMALNIVLTARGIPQVFYGTEIGMSHLGTSDHGLLRSDFPGGWHSDEVNAFTQQGLTAQQREIQETLKTVLNFRKSSDAIKSGKFTHFAPEKGIYVFFRHSSLQTVMVVVNKNTQPIELPLERFSSLLAEHNHAIDIITKERQWISDSSLALRPTATQIFNLHK